MGSFATCSLSQQSEDAEHLWPSALQRCSVAGLATAHDADGVDVATVRNLELSGLFDEAALPWTGIVMAIIELPALR